MDPDLVLLHVDTGRVSRPVSKRQAEAMTASGWIPVRYVDGVAVDLAADAGAGPPPAHTDEPNPEPGRA